MSRDIKKRNEIDNKYKWNIEAMYDSEEVWNSDVENALKLASEFASFEGKLTESSETLLCALQKRDLIWMTIEKAYVYARMKKDEDNTVEKYQAMNDKAQSAISKISSLMSFFIPEILASDEEIIYSMVETDHKLGVYKFMFEDIFREKEHILSKAEENILAQMSEITPATNNIFNMLNNADLKFGEIVLPDGTTSTLTHGNYITFMENHNSNVREQAFEKMYQSYKNLINTIASTYNFNTKKDVTLARIRKYSSARSASLSGDNINDEVYDNLISVIHDYLPVLHRYMQLRKKMLKTDKLKMSDVYVPLVEIENKNISFEDAVSIMTEALSPLGDEYISYMKKGLSEGWVDVYENSGKTSGAYSFGSYDSMPYILMNFSSTLKDVFTLVHEMGHSMHSFYTRKTQPYIYGDHSIFTAEVASTVNENLLMKYLISDEKDLQMKKYLINYHIEEFRTTVFRQTMFAEFEEWTHRTVEKGESLTAESMCNYYNELNRKYFGDAVEEDPWIKYEWARIPHFYNSFYVYKYATGYSAATAISDKILNNGPSEYLEFLKSGSSDYPIELLKIAGVDMSTREPVVMAMEVFRELVDELEKIAEL